MPRSLLFSIVVVTLVGLLGPVQAQPKKPKYPPSPHVAPTEALTPAEQLKMMSVPPGFEMQLVAAEPHIKNPMNIAFDARGRLWVTMSSEYPYPAKGPKTVDTVKILEDFGPDGKARKITTFADDLSIPIGVLPLGNGDKAIVFSIPNVYLFEDTDGDGRADKKTVLLKEYGQKDTHGLTGEFQLGFDGWIYACHGFSNTSRVTGTDGSTIEMQSGNTYRFKPDGSRLEYFTHGQVNPFGLSFDPLGNIYSTDCHSRPIYQLLRGAFYPSFGKPHDGIGFGPEMITHQHGSTALCGITYYAAVHFPKEFQDNIFIGNVVTNCINRDSLKKFGTTVLAHEEPDFVVSKDRWFRPVDIKLGQEGALYVADFYNRIIGHYEVPLDHPGRDKDHGRIWRIIYKGKSGPPPRPMFDWTKVSVKKLVVTLADPNLPRRMFATHQLVERGGKEGIQEVLNVFKQGGNAFQRVHGLWVLDRQNALPDSLLTAAAQDQDSIVRVHAMRVLAERQKWGMNHRKLALSGLKDANAFVQRTAAQALGNHPDVNNLTPLLELRFSVPPQDTHLHHVARMAIRDQLKPVEILTKAAKLNWAEKDFLGMADVTLSLPNAEVAAFLASRLPQLQKDPPRFPAYVKHLARFGDAKVQDQLIGFGKGQTPLEQEGMVKAIFQGFQERGQGLNGPIQIWAENLTGTLLSSKKNQDLLAGMELAGLLRIQPAQGALLKILQEKKRPEGQRSQAALALAKINPQKAAPTLGAILADSTQPMALRETAARALAEANLPEGREELVKSLSFAQAKLQNAIAVNLAGSKQGGEKLLDAVAKGKASPRLLQEKAVEQLLQKAKIPNLGKRLASLTKGLPSPDAKLLALMKQRIAGFGKAKADGKMGAMVFEKNCAACHQINNQGGKIAPQLDGVGLRGVDRLLEDIMDPNRNVDQEFRATTLVLKNGQIFNGLFIRQEGEIYVLADAQGKEQRFAKKDVEERVVSQMSPMPANWGEQISEADLYHMLAFLLEQRTAAKMQK